MSSPHACRPAHPLRLSLALALALLMLGLIAPGVAMAHPTLGLSFQAAPHGEARHGNDTYELSSGYGGGLHFDAELAPWFSLGASFEAMSWQTMRGRDLGYEPNLTFDFLLVPRLRLPFERGAFHSSFYLAAPVGPALDVPDRRASQLLGGEPRDAGVGLSLGARAGFQFFVGRVGAFTDLGVTGHWLSHPAEGPLPPSRVDSEMIWRSLRLGMIINLS